MILFLSAAISIASALLSPTQTCQAPETQRALQRGLLLYYAYNGPASSGAFEDAARASPRCAVAFWGEALAAGPNLNFPVSASGFNRAARAIRIAMRLRRNATPIQRELIEATNARFSGTFRNYETNEQRYVSLLRREVATDGRYSDDLAMILCEGLLEKLNGPPLWTAARTRQRDEVRSLLATVLRRDTGNLIANHLAVHFHDYDPDRGAALAYADRLARINVEADAEHLLHMSEHAYVRAGRYSEAVDASTHALELSDLPHYQLYYTHDYFVGLGAAFMGNDYRRAARYIDRFCRQGCRELSIAAAARFGKWDDVIAATEGHRDAFSLALYIRALLAKGETADANQAYLELKKIAPLDAESPNDTTVALAISRGDDDATAVALAQALQVERMPRMRPRGTADNLREAEHRSFLAILARR